MEGSIGTSEERRARKLARREEQRAANVGRAVAMHSARLAAPPSSIIPHHTLPVCNVGCSGWFYWHWRGAFYPQAMPTNEWFDHYATHFHTVELNAPFYSWPTINTVKSWVRQSKGRNILYTVKVCELVTHIKRFSRTQTLVKDCGFIADLLGPRMGCFLFQLPPSFHFTSARLKKILAQMDGSRRNVVEFRHASWWNPTVYAAFKKAKVIFCSCSGPKLPDELVTLTNEVYIRFHGVTHWYRHEYTPEEIGVWVERIRRSGCSRVWAYFNNDRDAHAVKNAIAFSQQLARAFNQPA